MTKRVILLGSGHAHVALLSDWARRPPSDTKLYIVSSARRIVCPGMLPDWLAGFYDARDLQFDLAPLARRAGAEIIVSDVMNLDANISRICLSDGRILDYDFASISTNSESDVSRLAEMGDRLIPASPVPVFIERWAHFQERAAGLQQIHIGVVGNGATAVELALGICASLRWQNLPALVSLFCAPGSFLFNHPPSVRRRLHAALLERGIDVHQAFVAGVPNGLLLSGGREIGLDCVIAATESRPPTWLARSGLARSKSGHVCVNSDLSSLSHPNVFATGFILGPSIATVPASGPEALRAGSVIAANLLSRIHSAKPHHYGPRPRTISLLSTCDRSAVLSWGQICASGKWVWWLKDRMNRRIIARHSLARQARRSIR